MQGRLLQGRVSWLGLQEPALLAISASASADIASEFKDNFGMFNTFRLAILQRPVLAAVLAAWLCSLALLGGTPVQAQQGPFAQPPTQGAAQAVAAGQVLFVSGSAARQTDSKPPQPLARDTLVHQGDQLSTGADGYVYVRMADGALLVLRPGSSLRIDQWHYNPQLPAQSQIRYTLQQGVGRYVSGKGSQAAKERFRFNTPMAAIGVRGTDFTVLARADLTQVAVRSGGVVVSPFDAGCARDALGPCEGRFATELFASADTGFLQLRSGEQRPQLIRPNGTPGPDQSSPPQSSEPTARNSKPAGTETAVIANSTEDRIDKLAATRSPAQEPALATWGRWGQLGADEAAAFMRQLLQERQLVAITPDHVLARNAALPMVLPETGVGSFRLTEHDGLYRDAAGTATQSTHASGGSLRIDFGQRRYQTELQLDVQGRSLTMQSSGTVDPGNLLQSSVLNPATSLKGLVGGVGAGQAAYLYRSRLPDGAEITGATVWGR